MELVVKRFNELTLSELYDILKLRVDVFVVEQAPTGRLTGMIRMLSMCFSGTATGLPHT